MNEHSYFNVINRTIWWPKKFGFRGNMLTRRVKEVSLLKQNHVPKPSPVKCIKNITKQEDGLFTMYMMNISKSLASFSGYH